MMSPQPGDPITVFDTHKRAVEHLCVAQHWCIADYADNQRRFFVDQRGTLLVCDEGITWIRGHLPLEAEAVQALIAARALTDVP